MKHAVRFLVVVLILVAGCAFERSAWADDGCGNYYNSSYYNPCPSPTYYYPIQTTYYQQPYYYTTPTTYYPAPTHYQPPTVCYYPRYTYMPPCAPVPQPCYAPPTYYRPVQVYAPPVIHFDFGGHHNRRCR